MNQPRTLVPTSLGPEPSAHPEWRAAHFVPPYPEDQIWWRIEYEGNNLHVLPSQALAKRALQLGLDPVADVRQVLEFLLHEPAMGLDHVDLDGMEPADLLALYRQRLDTARQHHLQVDVDHPVLAPLLTDHGIDQAMIAGEANTINTERALRAAKAVSA